MIDKNAMLSTVYDEKCDILVFAGDEESTRVKEQELLNKLAEGIKTSFDKLTEDTKKLATELGVALELKVIVKLT